MNFFARPIPAAQRNDHNAHRRAAYTLFEITLVVLIIGIAAATFLAAAGGDLHSARLKTAANVLASDIEFCQGDCINQPAAPRKIVFDTTANTYSIVNTVTGAIIPHPADSMPFTNDFSTGRNAQLAGVKVISALMGGASTLILQFDAYGRPLITADMTVTLQYNGSSQAVVIKAFTGDVSISDAVAAASAPADDGTLNDNGNNKDNGNGQKNGVNKN